jgi:hypothetical protein
VAGIRRKSAEECRIGVVWKVKQPGHGKAITQVASVRPSKCFASQHIALKSGVMGVEWQPAACELLAQRGMH